MYETKADIDALIAAQAGESAELDYKEGLPGSGTEVRKELLRDVASFANGAGGHILFGVAEDRATGTPVEPRGIPGNLDQEVLRLDQIARSGLDPRVPGLRFRSVGGYPNGGLIVAQIPRSWVGPHMVNDDGRFYSRGSAGRITLNAAQIRAAFLGTAAVGDRIKRFRDERLGRVVAGDTPARALGTNPKVVLHMVPFAALDPEHAIALAAWEPDAGQLMPFDGAATTWRYNLDGSSCSRNWRNELSTRRISPTSFFDERSPPSASNSSNK